MTITHLLLHVLNDRSQTANIKVRAQLREDEILVRRELGVGLSELANNLGNADAVSLGSLLHCRGGLLAAGVAGVRHDEEWPKSSFFSSIRLPRYFEIFSYQPPDALH